jgi:hypothetical protein
MAGRTAFIMVRVTGLTAAAGLVLLGAACGSKDRFVSPGRDVPAGDASTPETRDPIAAVLPDGARDSPDVEPADAGGAEDGADAAAFLSPTRQQACAAHPYGTDEADFGFLVSPAKPVAGKPLRVVFVSGSIGDADRLFLQDATGRRRIEGLESWGGPPWAWGATLQSVPTGRLRFCLSAADEEQPVACKVVMVEVAPRAETIASSSSPPVLPSGVWPIERTWDRTMENLYAAWIARLFLVEPGMSAGWRPLHKALRDPQRNLLFNHLGMAEDDPDSTSSAVLTPDCGDAPYFLRAYFAWKMRLPFAAHLCRRGTPGEGPGCEGGMFTNLTPAFDDLPGPIERLNAFLAEGVARFVHSGTARTLPEEEATDFYPVGLSRASLRPGVIFVDPRGHILILTRWLPGTERRIGTLFAVDGHPDQSISHKRFSPPNFFFSPTLRTGGFKAFRPLGYAEGRFCFATNEQLRAEAPATQLSEEAFGFPDGAAFYAHLDRMLNPFPPDPALAFRDRMELLMEMLVDRETAIRVAVDFMDSTGWEKIPIPSGPAIFTTYGPWESYATPARDLRLLIAADELLGFPKLVQDSPGAFTIPPEKTPEQIRAELDAAWVLGQTELKIEYRRSDGSSWTLALGDFMGRLRRFEQAYNPNDCPEVRWGAAEGTDEYATCVHRTPAAQQRLMDGYRFWFAVRRQPTPPPP